MQKEKLKANHKCKKFWPKLGELLLTGIVLAVVASLLTNFLMNRHEQKQERQQLINNTQNIYIGCNSNWMNERFGTPQFTAHKEGYTLCAYVSDYYVIQIAFDSGNSAKAYFITELENCEDALAINDNTMVLSNDITLDKTSFYDIPGAPFSVHGFVSNGNVRAAYAEEYYYNGGGNHYNYYYASLDFGKTGTDVLGFIQKFAFQPEKNVDDEVPYDMVNGMQVIRDRNKICPNTYGVADREVADVYNLFCSYDWFNSIQIRNKYHDTSSLFED